MGNPAKTKELRGFIDTLILPLLKLRPENINHHDWLDRCFNTEQVIIRRWKGLSSVTLPARRKIFLDDSIPSTLHIIRGDEVYTREHLGGSNEIMVEVIRPKGDFKSKIYFISPKTWRKLEVYLQHRPFKEFDKNMTIDWSMIIA